MPNTSQPDAPGVRILGQLTPSTSRILNPSALHFLTLLHRTFNHTRLSLLEARAARQKSIDAGHLPDFLPETKSIREDATWRGAAPAPGLVDRRVEITGPTDRKMVVNALNAEVWTYMADFEDSSAPTWANMANGQLNLYDAVRRQIDFKQGPKSYALRSETDRPLPTLIVRPRGWHLDEAHLLIDGEPISASLFDFGLFFFHNAAELVKRGFGPYFYLPKMESHLEARLWNDVFVMAQDVTGMNRGTIRATVLIETILAAFEMDEIIYELREHSSGLNCGRWDYIFSVIKKFREHKEFVLPDRKNVTMTAPFMEAYCKLLVQTCHKRGVHAMGGMAAQIPIKDDEARNKKAMEGVRADKMREVKLGHDGTWVAHPALASIAASIFNTHMPTPNQMFIRRTSEAITASSLLNMTMPSGSAITHAGLVANIDISLRYTEGWLRGVGCVPIDSLMEDAATAEVSRSQVWQWVRHGVSVEASGGKKQVLTKEMVAKVLREQAQKLMESAAKGNKFAVAEKYLRGEIMGEHYSEFLTTLLYDEITTKGKDSTSGESKL